MSYLKRSRSPCHLVLHDPEQVAGHVLGLRLALDVHLDVDTRLVVSEPLERDDAGQRSDSSAGSNVVRPISAASQPSRNSRMPWLSPGTKLGSANSAGQPSAVVA